MTMEEEGCHDWMIDEDDEEVYDPLARLVERWRNLGVAGMRRLNRDLYNIKSNETDTADKQYLVRREQYRNRRDRLTKKLFVDVRTTLTFKKLIYSKVNLK